MAGDGDGKPGGDYLEVGWAIENAILARKSRANADPTRLAGKFLKNGRAPIQNQYAAPIARSDRHWPHPGPPFTEF